MKNEKTLVSKMLLTNGITCFCYSYLTVFLFVLIWGESSFDERSLFLILGEVSILLSASVCTSKKHRQFICKHCYILVSLMFVCDIVSVSLLFVDPYYKALFESLSFEIFGTFILTFYSEVKEAIIDDANRRNDFMIASEKVNSFSRICGALASVLIPIESLTLLVICFSFVAVIDFLMTMSVFRDVNSYLKLNSKNFHCFN